MSCRCHYALSSPAPRADVAMLHMHCKKGTIVSENYALSSLGLGARFDLAGDSNRLGSRLLSVLLFSFSPFCLLRVHVQSELLALAPHGKLENMHWHGNTAKHNSFAMLISHCSPMMQANAWCLTYRCRFGCDARSIYVRTEFKLHFNFIYIHIACGGDGVCLNSQNVRLGERCVRSTSTL